MKGRSSITTSTLLLIAAAVGVIIVVVASITYEGVFRASEEREILHLNQYTSERASRLEEHCAEIRRNLETARGAYLDRYLHNDPPGFLELWDVYFEHSADGAWRSRLEYSNDYQYAPLWAHKDVGPSEDFKRRILIMFEVCAKFLPGWVRGFRSLYGFTNDEMAVIGFDPALAGWVYDQAPDYNINEEEFGKLASVTWNPLRQLRWTGTTSDASSAQSLVSVVLPVDLNDEPLISVAHDMRVDELIAETTRAQIIGLTHMLFREDGRLIAYPDRAADIFSGKGQLNMATAGDETLSLLYATVSKRKERIFGGYDPGSGNYYAVHRIAGPEWFYLTKLPRSILRQQAFASTQWVLWSALGSLALELSLLGIILRRAIAKPVAELVAATRRIEAGEMDVSLVLRQDELGELAAAFTDMAGKVRARDAALREEKASLEQRVAERTEALETALAQQTELARLKSDFVTLVSHEFRTPLGVIMSSADVLRLFYRDLPDEKRQSQIGKITRATKTLASLMDQVLLIRRAEEGGLRFEVAPVNLSTLCPALVEEVSSGGAKEVTIQLTLGPGLEGATSDEALLRHIICNLLSNAVKYSEPGQPVEFSVARDADRVLFTVRDHGIGIPPEDRGRLFHSFVRGGNVGSRPGTGLGLVIVKHCVDLHGGSIELESTPGGGTIFKVALPMFGGLADPNPAVVQSGSASVTLP